MIVLYNPSNEEFHMQHAGISMSMKADTKLEVSDACGRHVLNAMGQRGLTQLTYGCDEEKIKKEALGRNLAFKKKQIMEYNQKNENRKQMGLAYLPPTTNVTDYSLELAITLLEPFTMKDAEKQKISDAEVKNVALEEELTEVKKMMAEILAEQKRRRGGRTPAKKDE